MNIDDKQMNIPSLTISKIVNSLAKLYGNAVMSNIALKSIPTPFLWGPAGIGKSEGVYQLAAQLENITNKTVVVTDVRLLLFSPVDLRGVPMADQNKRFTNWLMPKLFDMRSDDSVLNILFLDELSAAPQSVQASAYQICLDRRIGEFALPDNCIVVAAGNRTTDQSVSYKMPKALCNRLMHFNVKTDYEQWRTWAIEHDISDKIIAYLAMDNSRLCLEPETSDLAYPTPRSWAFVSSILRGVDGNLEDSLDLVAACIGIDTAVEFNAFCKGCANIPQASEIFKGRCKDVPKSHDVMYATISALTSKIKDREASITIDELDNCVAYVTRMPPDFCMSFMKDIVGIKGINSKLMKCRGFQSWVVRNKLNV